MKFTVIFVALAALVSTNALAADYLKSKKLRQMACESIESFLDDEGLQIEYDNDWGETVVVLPDFHEKCKSAKKSFEVTKYDYNKKAEAITEMDIKVEFKMSGYLTVYGPLTFKRSAFDPETGDVKLGEWKIYGSQFGFELGPNSVKKLAEAMINSADIHNGDSALDKHNAMEYSLEKEVAELQAWVDEHNEETKKDARDYYSEEEIENGEADLCLYSDAQGDAEDLFTYAEEMGSGNSNAPRILELLKSKGWVFDIIGAESEIWEEHCAFYGVQIYLKDGTVIVLDYDFTT